MYSAPILFHFSEKDSSKQGTSGLNTDTNKTDGKDMREDVMGSRSREDLLLKLKLLAITEEDDDFNSDDDDEKDDINFDNYTDDLA